jgi:hypothetical protein
MIVLPRMSPRRSAWFRIYISQHCADFCDNSIGHGQSWSGIRRQWACVLQVWKRAVRMKGFIRRQNTPWQTWKAAGAWSSATYTADLMSSKDILSLLQCLQPHLRGVDQRQQLQRKAFGRVYSVRDCGAPGKCWHLQTRQTAGVRLTV